MTGRVWGLGLAGVVVFGAATGWWAIADWPRPWRGSLAYSQQVVDRQGEVLRLYTTTGGYWRLPVDQARVDSHYLPCLLAFEDRRFLHHTGVDALALLRALWQRVRDGRWRSGASTLSMQTIRLLEPHPRTIASKFIEMVQALRMEAEWSKEQILELYLSLAPFGGNIQGLTAASLLYFGHGPQHLSAGELSWLIALPQAPEQRRPDRHLERGLVAVRQVGRRLQATGCLGDQSPDLTEAPRRRAAPLLAAQLADRLHARYPESLRIDTHIDGHLQRRLERQAVRWQQSLEPGATSAVVIADHRTRQVVAHLGSGDFLKVSQLDLTRAARSPGSALKPFVYGLAFERNWLHPETRVLDRPETIDGYAPENFARRYLGNVSIREALQQSLNIPAVKVLHRIRPLRLVRWLEEVGAHPRLPGVEEPGLPIILGGLGLQLEELMGLYAALARSGEYQPLSLTADDPQPPPKRVLGEVAAWYLDEILRDTPAPAGYANRLGIRYKTGTSYGFRDAWAFGYNATHVVGIWVGRPDGGYSQERTGGNSAAPLLFQVFEWLPFTPSPARPPPAGALVARWADLPDNLRGLPDEMAEAAGAEVSPRIRSPQDGAVFVWDGHSAVSLSAEGGVPPYRWLVNGQPLSTLSFERHIQWQPQSPGQNRVTLIDGRGRQSGVEFWLEP